MAERPVWIDGDMPRHIIDTRMDDVAARLGRLDSCAVSDALDKLGLKGAVTGIHRFSTDRRIRDVP